jgi:hypothetical protein
MGHDAGSVSCRDIYAPENAVRLRCCLDVVAADTMFDGSPQLGI